MWLNKCGMNAGRIHVDNVFDLSYLCEGKVDEVGKKLSTSNE